MKKIIILLLIYFFNFSKSYAQICINFSDIASAQITNDCKFVISGIPMKLYTIGDSFQVCTRPTMTVGTCIIQKEDFPNHQYIDKIICKTIETNNWLGDVGFYAIYKDGSTNNIHISEVDSSLIMENFQNIDSFAVSGGFEGAIYSDNNQQPVSTKIKIIPVFKSVQNCSESDITYIELMLADSLMQKEMDYHIYTVENIICDPAHPTGQRPNTLDEVWSFMKSNNIYQFPLKQDFPPLEQFMCGIFGINSLLFCSAVVSAFNQYMAPNTGPFGIPVQSCDKIFLHPTPLRVATSYLIHLEDKLIGLSSLGNCHSDISREPIMIIVDEGKKCITNYTLNGHFLYPGKVQRCLFADGCDGKIKIITTGAGFTTCTGNWVGRRVKDMNIYIGKYAFDHIDKRLIYDFNH